MFVINPFIGGFSPPDITGLVAWWDAQDNSTITTATGVSVWADKSVSGISLDQATASFQPALLTVNGRQMIDFDGNDNTMASTDGGVLKFAAGEFSIFVVYKTNDVNRGLILHRGAFSPEGYLIRMNNADNNNGEMPMAIRDDASNLAQVIAGAVSGTNYNDDTVRQMAMVRDNGASELQQFQEGTEVTESPASTAAVGDIDETSTFFWVGSFQNASQFYDGQIGEIVIYDNALSVADRGSVVNYLSARWGI